MRSTDEQLREIMRRAETVKAKRILRKRIQASAIASCACVALLIAVCFYLPRLSVIQAAPGLQQYGSLAEAFLNGYLDGVWRFPS